MQRSRISVIMKITVLISRLCLLLLFIWIHQLITQTFHRNNIFWTVGVVLYLFPQMPDMYHNRIVTAEAVLAC